MSEKRIGQPANAQIDLEKAFAQLTDEKIRIQTGMELIELYYGAGALDKAAAVVSVLRQLSRRILKSFTPRIEFIWILLTRAC